MSGPTVYKKVIHDTCLKSLLNQPIKHGIHELVKYSMLLNFKLYWIAAILFEHLFVRIIVDDLNYVYSSNIVLLFILQYRYVQRTIIQQSNVDTVRISFSSEPFLSLH